MHAYGVDYLMQCFREFIHRDTLVPHDPIDGTPMGRFREGRPVNVDVYCRALLARNASGVCRRNFPALTIPPASTAAGILSVLPLSALHIGDFSITSGFEFLLINCEGANTNRKAVRMLMSGLRNRRDLLAVAIFARLTESTAMRSGDLAYSSTETFPGASMYSWP